ncbi:MAG TPA: hypothetical protein VL068_07430, partial [Microthrixaceae bacterium]|nr:hypothetical protein [Microthrixaceae bacterium]
NPMANSNVLTETISGTISSTGAALERTIRTAIDTAKSANGIFRTHDDVAVTLPGGLFGHVRNGKLVGFGLEPIGDVLVDSQRRVSNLVDGEKGRVLWGRVAAVAGGSAAAVSSVAGVATAVILGRRGRAAA